LWHNGRIGNKPESAPGYCLREFVVKRANGKMLNIDGEVVPIALCNLLLWIRIVVKANWSLGPSFSWI
jgi:hypothetical protein